jgi:hypothetical protein
VKKWQLFLLLLLVSVGFLNAQSSDYLIGLKAYKDGLYDISKSSLEGFIKNGRNERDLIFAKYILANIYVKENNYKKALNIITELEKISDERIDENYLKTNKLYILTVSNCGEAEKYLVEHPENNLVNLFLSSKCELNNRVTNIIKKNNISNSNKLAAISKASKDIKTAASIFESLDLKRLDKNRLFELATYFYNNNYFDPFWKIYSYKNNDMLVNLALQRLWDIQSEEDFLDNFEYNVNKFKIAKLNYCRAIKIYKEKNETFNCAFIDSCFQVGSKNFIESKLSCLINKKDREGLSLFIEKNKDRLEYICPFSSYLIDVKFYNNKILYLFSKCRNKYTLAEKLVKKSLFKDIPHLINTPVGEKDYFYLAIAYKKLGKLNDYNKFKVYVKDIKLLKELDSF